MRRVKCIGCLDCNNIVYVTDCSWVHTWSAQMTEPVAHHSLLSFSSQFCHENTKALCLCATGSSEVQDAYVIAVEDEARHRLNQLSALHKVKAVDLSTIHQEEPLDSKSDHEDITESESGDSEFVEEIQNIKEPQHIEEEPRDLAKVVLLEGAHTGESSTEDIMHHHPYEDVMDPGDQENIPQPQHREMAIDCPTGFVGIKKEPPRLPQQFHNSSTSSPRGTPSKRRALDNATNVMVVNNYKASDDHDQMERIKKYQEDLRKRREEDERIQREQEFLRTSLRGSKKLQELEENKVGRHVAPAGIDNPNYVLEEEEEGGNNKSAASSATLPVRTLNYEGLIQQPLGEYCKILVFWC